MNCIKIIIFIAIFLVSCKEEFLLNNSMYMANLVVDGAITNETGPYIVKLTQTSPVNNYEYIPVEQAKVIIRDISGQSEILKETEPGVYVSDTNGIQGLVGNSYSLSIITSNGKEYISDYEEMMAPVAIDDVKAELINKETQEYPLGLPGYQFYISTEVADGNDNYFMWRMEETYEFTVDFNLYDIYFNNPYIDTNELIKTAIIQDYISNYFRCWETNDINYIYTGKTSNLSIPQINDHPFLFVGTNSKRLTHRYSLLVRQYNITQNAYNFWNSIENQFSEDNFLVTNQAVNSTSNVYNSENPDEIVYGYFTVGSVSKKRIFVDTPNDLDFHYDQCSPVTEPDVIDFIMGDPSFKPPFYFIAYDNSLGVALLQFEYCINCTLSGGENTKPDFWIE